MIITIVGLIIIAVKFVGLFRQNKANLETIDQIKYSYAQEVKNLNAQMNNLAGERFQEWRRSECENIKIQERETALKDASVQLEQWIFQSETTIRSDAIQRSQSVIIGKVSEHLLPYMPDFPFNPKDVRFIGSPIDLIVFDGMSDGDIRQVVLVEIKTGQSAALTQRERQIRNAIQSNKVTWQEMRIHRAEGN